MEVEVVIVEEELVLVSVWEDVLIGDAPVVFVLGEVVRNVTAKKLPPRIMTTIAAIAKTVVSDGKGAQAISDMAFNKREIFVLSRWKNKLTRKDFSKI